MKYEKPDMSIIMFCEEVVITVASGGTGQNGGFDYDVANENPDI